MAAITRTSTWRSTDPTDALERLLLEKPQQLRLKGRHDLADFVQKHGPAVGRFEQAALLPIRAGERAAFVDEQLTFEQSLGQGRAGDVHEGTGGARAGVVEDHRREILPGAALAGQQHCRGRARCDLLQQRPQRGDRRAHAHDAVQAIGARLRGTQHAHFPAQLRGFQRLLDEERDFVDVERLVGVVIGAVLHRLHGGLDARVGSEEDHQRVRVRFFDLFQDSETVRIGQPIIEQDEIDPFATPLERVGRGPASSRR